jgi:ferredoxin
VNFFGDTDRFLPPREEHVRTYLRHDGRVVLRVVSFHFDDTTEEGLRLWNKQNHLISGIFGSMGGQQPLILENPREYIKTDFIMTVNAELCTGCESCVDRCQFDALSVPEDVCIVDIKRCIGCGVCAIVCPEGALELVRDESPNKPEQPANQLDWMTKRAMSRGVDPSDIM